MIRTGFGSRTARRAFLRLRLEHAVPLVSLLSTWIAIAPAHTFAQERSDVRVQAAYAYDRGVSSLLAREYIEAAHWFEAANRLVPSPVALAQAVRSYTYAGEDRRAGSLALRLLQQEGVAPRLREIADAAVAAARQRYLLVDVECASTCTIQIDGTDIEGARAFVDAGRDALVSVRFADGSTQRQTAHGEAGETVTLSFAPASSLPAANVEEAPLDPHDLEREAGSAAENPYRISRYRFFSRPKATFFAVLLPTVISGGMFTWSALDTRDARHALASARMTGDAVAIAVAENEHSRDVRRTKWFAVQFGVFSFAAVMIAAFTDWTPHGDRTHADLSISRGSLALHLDRSF